MLHLYTPKKEKEKNFGILYVHVQLNMLRSILVFLTLFIAVSSQRATVTLLQPRMYDASSNTNSYCNVKNLANPASPILDNCPGRSQCVEISNGKGRCTVFSLSEHQGATAFDFTASKVLQLETQIDASRSAISCDLTDVTTQNSDAKKWRCIEIATHMFLADSESTDDYESSCTVTYHGNIGSQMTTGTIGTTGMDGATLSSGFAADSTNKKLSCHVVPQNNLYIGYAYMQVTFTKKTAKLALGEKPAKIVKVPVKYVPGNKVDGGSTEANDGYYADPDLQSAHELISQATASDGIHSSTSDKGTLKLSYRFTMLDSRYLVNSQSGVETLNKKIGDFRFIKEGLEIHSDYSNFYDSSKNQFVNSGIMATPIAFANYKSGACTKSGKLGTNSATGVSMDTSVCTATSNYYDRKYAQYDLSGVYQATYGTLDHFKKGYVGCQLCSNRLAIQGFETQAGSVELDVAVDIDVTTLQSGCVGDANAGTYCVTLPNVFADAVTSGGILDSKVLRLPNCDTSGANCGSAGGYDPQNAQGHSLGEFFTPRVSGTTQYADYDAEFDFLSTNRLVVTDSTKELANSAQTGLQIGAACETAGKGKVYELSNDMLSAANNLFYTQCKIIVLDKEFAKTSTIIFFESEAAKTACTTATCTDAVYSTVVQVDKRRILVGDTELSLLRRKTASVDKAGAAITMKISKYTETPTQVLHFDIKGTNTMIGYDNLGAKCTTAGQANCNGEVAVDTELQFSTSAVNGVIKEHTLRSSVACTGFLDIQLQDLNSTFAIYDLRLPCSRTTATTSDRIDLTWDFTLSYDLVDNKVVAEAHYLNDMGSFNETDFDSASMPSGLKQNLVVSASFGTCSAANVIQRVNHSGAFVGCDGDANNNGQFADQAGSAKFLSDGLNLDGWSHCAWKVEDDNANDQYVVTTNIAMLYDRKVTYTSGTGTTFSENKFCASRKFITTIKRDASATVSVSTLRAPTLERAVNVQDIEWVECNGAGSGQYELHITIYSKEKDVTSSTWIDSPLNSVLKPTVSYAVDSDQLSIDLAIENPTNQPMSLQNPSNKFTLVSSCIAISTADCAERCDSSNVCTAQSTSDSTATGESAQSAFSKLTHTETDLVLRGDFAGGSVDSDVKITTLYVQCPVDVSNTATGFLRAAAHFQCDAEISNVSSTSIDSQTNCDQAYTTDKGQAQVALYITNTSSSTHLLTAAEATSAVNAGWEIRHSKIYIERYEKLFSGAEGTLLSSEAFCECGNKSTPYVASTAAACKDHSTQSDLKDRVFGLTPFTTLDCGRVVNSENKYDQLRIDFVPLSDATNDIFKIRFVLLAESNDLDSSSSRRRLRTISYSQTLKSTSALTADAGSFSVVSASYNTAGDIVTPPSQNPSSAEEDDDEGISVGLIIVLIIVYVIVWHAIPLYADVFWSNGDKDYPPNWFFLPYPEMNCISCCTGGCCVDFDFADLALLIFTALFNHYYYSWAFIFACFDKGSRANNDSSSGSSEASTPGVAFRTGYKKQRFSNLRY